jgi:hypothetical protein
VVLLDLVPADQHQPDLFAFEPDARISGITREIVAMAC